jgi:hypothetical protein
VWQSKRKLPLKSINLGRIFAYLSVTVKGRSATHANFFATQADLTAAEASSWGIITGSTHPVQLKEGEIASIPG